MACFLGRIGKVLRIADYDDPDSDISVALGGQGSGTGEQMGLRQQFVRDSADCTAFS